MYVFILSRKMQMSILFRNHRFFTGKKELKRKQKFLRSSFLMVLGKVSKSNRNFLRCSIWYQSVLCSFADIQGRKPTLLSPLPWSGDHYSAVMGPCLTTPRGGMFRSSHGSPALQPGALLCSSTCLH